MPHTPDRAAFNCSFYAPFLLTLVNFLLTTSSLTIAVFVVGRCHVVYARTYIVTTSAMVIQTGDQWGGWGRRWRARDPVAYL